MHRKWPNTSTSWAGLAALFSCPHISPVNPDWNQLSQEQDHEDLVSCEPLLLAQWWPQLHGQHVVCRPGKQGWTFCWQKWTVGGIPQSCCRMERAAMLYCVKPAQTWKPICGVLRAVASLGSGNWGFQCISLSRNFGFVSPVMSKHFLHVSVITTESVAVSSGMETWSKIKAIKVERWCWDEFKSIHSVWRASISLQLWFQNNLCILFPLQERSS